MGRRTFLGGSSTILGGRWTTHDPLEVRNPRIAVRPPKPDVAPAKRPPAPKPATRSERQAAAVKKRRMIMMDHARSCAAADRAGRARPARPPELKSSWLCHQKQRDKFEALIQSLL